MIRDIAIYGAGGLGREMALMIQQINESKKTWNLIGFFDDNKAYDATVEELPVFGGIDQLNAVNKPMALMVAIADSKTRFTVVSRITNQKVNFPVLIHPASLVGSKENKFGRGSIITAGNILTTGINIGEFVIINLSCTIGHDVTLGSYSSIMPGANISGSVSVGSQVLVGTGAKVLQGRTLGNGSKIGAGAVVVKDVIAGTTVIGVPAKIKHK